MAEIDWQATAAMVQAIGSVLAILVAVWIPLRLKDQADKEDCERVIANLVEAASEVENSCTMLAGLRGSPLSAEGAMLLEGTSGYISQLLASATPERLLPDAGEQRTAIWLTNQQLLVLARSARRDLHMLPGAFDDDVAFRTRQKCQNLEPVRFPRRRWMVGNPREWGNRPQRWR